jgi:transaldolase
VQELTYAIKNGAVGATTNPVIVGEVLKKELYLWEERIAQLIKENPTASEDDITWRLNEAMAMKGAEFLQPVFKREKKKKGRISIQTNPKYFRNKDLMVEQAVYFDRLAPNMQVKIPVSTTGIAAIEEATYRGVSVNATVSFTVPQAIAVAEAIEKGLKRREAEGLDVAAMSPVCTIMVGRIDDWLRVVADRDDIITDPGNLNWAGVAVMKKAYELYRQREYRARLLSAAYRCHMHWSEFIGGDLIVSIPYQWQVRFNQSDVAVIPRMDNPVPPKILDELLLKFKEFRKAYEEDGIKVKDFDSFGANRRTMRQFIGGYESLVGFIRERMIPNPDRK